MGKELEGSLFGEKKGKVLPGYFQEPGQPSELWEGRGLPPGTGINPRKNRSCWYRLSMGKEDFLMGHGP